MTKPVTIGFEIKINKPGISLFIHYGISQVIENYY